MRDLTAAIAVLNEINSAIRAYDPVLKEAAVEILLQRAFGGAAADSRSGAPLRARALRGSFADLLARWTPATASDRVLLAVYFLSGASVEGNETTRAVTHLLREHGLEVANPSQALRANVRRAPAHLRAAKEGTSPKARQRFSLTSEGAAYVERMLGG